MKKNIIVAASILLGVAVSTSSLIAYGRKTKLVVNNQIASTQTVDNLANLEDEKILSYVDSMVKEKKALIRQQQEIEYAKIKAEEENERLIASNIENVYNTAPSKGTSTGTVYSRGGTPPVQGSKVELLDWWKDGRVVFAVNTIAEVMDLYTGKTFKVKRTMGTNHADTEALTKQDTDIIKDIWGGFSWTRRPIILNINGRRLAASMSAMPHAGLDSAPLNAIVDNRSEGYGRGENLDAIKGNGMDGHFDIHFLNSTRHMDGQMDPEHQSAVRKAAGR